MPRSRFQLFLIVGLSVVPRGDTDAVVEYGWPFTVAHSLYRHDPPELLLMWLSVIVIWLPLAPSVGVPKIPLGGVSTQAKPGFVAFMALNEPCAAVPVNSQIRLVASVSAGTGIGAP